MKATVLRSLVVFVSLFALGMVALSPHYYAHAQGDSSGGGGGCCGGGMGGSVPATTQQLTCGAGTHQANGMCVPNTTGNSNNSGGSNGSNSGNQSTQAPTLNTQSIQR